MDLLPRQQAALAGLKCLFGLLLLIGVVWILALACGCSPRKEVVSLHHESSLIAASIAAGLEANDAGGRVYLVAATGSMEPTFKGGDYVVGVKTPFEDLKVGMIVNYFPEWAPKLLVIHRLVAKWPNGDGWIAEGDSRKNTAEIRSRVMAANYVDHVVSIYRSP